MWKVMIKTFSLFLFFSSASNSALQRKIRTVLPSWKPQVCNYIKKETLHVRFPVNFAKHLKTPLLSATFGQLLLSSLTNVIWLIFYDFDKKMFAKKKIVLTITFTQTAL